MKYMKRIPEEVPEYLRELIERGPYIKTKEELERWQRKLEEARQQALREDPEYRAYMERREAEHRERIRDYYGKRMEEARRRHGLKTLEFVVACPKCLSRFGERGNTTTTKPLNRRERRKRRSKGENTHPEAFCYQCNERMIYIARGDWIRKKKRKIEDALKWPYLDL